MATKMTEFDKLARKMFRLKRVNELQVMTIGVIVALIEVNRGGASGRGFPRSDEWFDIARRAQDIANYHGEMDINVRSHRQHEQWKEAAHWAERRASNGWHDQWRGLGATASMAIRDALGLARTDIEIRIEKQRAA